MKRVEHDGVVAIEYDESEIAKYGASLAEQIRRNPASKKLAPELRLRFARVAWRFRAQTWVLRWASTSNRYPGYLSFAAYAARRAKGTKPGWMS